MLKIGVLGVGHLGKIHLKCIQAIEQLQLIGIYDPIKEKAAEAAANYGITAFENELALIEAVDIVDIVSPTTTHFRLASLALKAGKHLFIEKPITETPAQAVQLQALLQQHPNLKVQIGHVERFNPAFLAIQDQPLNPMFIEGHRLATFNPRGTDVSVILDLMIHDLDIVLHLVNSPIHSVSASGVAVVSSQPDICNARLEFENGCVANLTASRISLKQMRKLRLFQKDAYISLDFLKKEVQQIQLFDQAPANSSEEFNLMELNTNEGTKYIRAHMPEIPPTNAIQAELAALVNSIQNNTTPPVTIQSATKVIELAHRIIDEVHQRQLNAVS